MTFKIGNCIRLSTLTSLQYREVLVHLSSLGYFVRSVDYLLKSKSNWEFLGVDQWGDVQLYDNAYSYLDINAWQIEHPTNILNYTDLGI